MLILPEDYKQLPIHRYVQATDSILDERGYGFNTSDATKWVHKRDSGEKVSYTIFCKGEEIGRIKFYAHDETFFIFPTIARRVAKSGQATEKDDKLNKEYHEILALIEKRLRAQMRAIKFKELIYPSDPPSSQPPKKRSSKKVGKKPLTEKEIAHRLKILSMVEAERQKCENYEAATARIALKLNKQLVWDTVRGWRKYKST